MKHIITIALIILTRIDAYSQPQIWSIVHAYSQYDAGITKYDVASGSYTREFNFDKGYFLYGLIPQTICVASNGKFYGTTRYGGNTDNGVIFEFDPLNNGYIKLFDLDSTSGFDVRDFFQGSDGNLYGRAIRAGIYNSGTLFKYDLYSNIYNKLYDFDSLILGTGSLIEDINSKKLYGTCGCGISTDQDAGMLFEYDLNTNTLKKKFAFKPSNGFPKSIVLHSNGKIYGTTYGPTFNSTIDHGEVFEYDPLSDTYTALVNFSNTQDSSANFWADANGNIYGISSGRNPWGTDNGSSGSIFEYNVSSNSYNAVWNFNNAPNGDSLGYRPTYFTLATNGKLYGATFKGGLYNVGVFYEFDPSTKTYRKIVDNNVTNIPHRSVELIAGTGLHENHNINLKIYPNPANASLTISMGTEIIKSVHLLNVLEETLLTTDSDNLNTANLPAGTYFIKVITDNTSVTKKLIVEH